MENPQSDKTILDYIQMIGPYVAFILLIFQVLDRYSTLRRFILNSIHFTKSRCHTFRENRWWNQYSPRCEIFKIEELKVIQFKDNTYNMELDIAIKYKSRDHRHETKMDITSIYLDVASSGKGRDSKPYRLSRTNFPLQVYPREENEDSKGGYLVKNLSWNLQSLSEVIIRYTFFGQFEAKPLLGSSASVRIISIGKAEIEGVSQSKQLKAPKIFLVKVDWLTQF